MTTSTITPCTTDTNTNTVCEIGTQVAFNCINQPGAYVCNATGHMVRVNDNFDTNAMNAWCNWHGNQPFWFTCVSTNPNATIEECRSNAGNAGIAWSF
jgi:hypothetical protein